MKKRALISVTNKEGLVPFAQALVNLGWEIISTGGTAKAIREGGVPCIEVADVTGYPEMMDGRVRTLHPGVFGGIIADRDVVSHMNEAANYRIGMIDMVVVNLYDFAKRPSINEIDVGGPSMLRAAAKNHKHVIVVPSPVYYVGIIQQLGSKGDIPILERQLLAERVFEITAQYDADIRDHFRKVREAGGQIELGKHGG
jgi:phosphoribosylaminoimidazolecarboxamide formyltransferase/IMP cyclohydrolase